MTSIAWVPLVLGELKTKTFSISNETKDPTSEAEFKKLEFTSDTPITWPMYQAAFEKVKSDRKDKQLRAYRDKLLQESDWVTNPVNWDTIQNKDEWLVYRQTLRDLPANVKEVSWDWMLRVDFTKLTLPQKPKLIRIQSPMPA